MKNLIYITTLLTMMALMSLSYFSCSPDKNAPTRSISNLIFQSSLRTDGTSFYAMDNTSGQIYFMLDFGKDRGLWKPYGEKLEGPSSSYLFDVVERPAATSFYAVDARTGQLFYASDNSETGGKWNTYGDVIRQSGINMLQFDALGRFDGNSFYAFDSMEGQMYFMNDFGDNAGKWTKYGNEVR